MDKDALQLLLARGVSVEQIGRRFGRHPSTISYWMRKYGLEAPNRAKHASKGGIERERLTQLVGRGMTIGEIAEEVGLSKGAVRHWLGRYGLQTSRRPGERSGPRGHEAKQAGRLTVTMTCVHHGESEFLLEGRGAYRCRLCRSEALSLRRQTLTAMLVADAGGRCCLCGYDRHIGALHFHHVDPGAPRTSVSAARITDRIDRFREAARTRVLLCSNCHAEVEAGVRALPLHLAERAGLAGV
jgi:transposase-like protein